MHVNKADGVMFCMRLMELLRRARDDDANGACKYVTYTISARLAKWLPWRNKSAHAGFYDMNFCNHTLLY